MRMSSIAGAFVLAVATTGLTATRAEAAGPLKITGIDVTDVQLTGPNSLLATLDLTGQLSGQNFTLHNLQLPIRFAQTGVTTDANGDLCPILSLSLEIEYLNILGLVVELNNCHEGPITVDITAQEGGGLLGDLLCGLLGPNGLLNLDLANIANLESLIEQVLGGIFGELTGSGTPAPNPTTGGSNQASPNACPVLNLELGAIHLDLLGLNVDTSDICLFVYAEPDQGVLGDLLCSVTDLLNGGGNQNAINSLVRNILRVILRRGL